MSEQEKEEVAYEVERLGLDFICKKITEEELNASIDAVIKKYKK